MVFLVENAELKRFRGVPWIHRNGGLLESGAFVVLGADEVNGGSGFDFAGFQYGFMDAKAVHALAPEFWK